VDVNLSLSFDTDMPLLAVIDRMSTMASTNPDDYDVRYRINAYRIQNNGTLSTEPAAEWIFSRPEITVFDYNTTVYIEPGNYRFHAWVDYVDNNTTDDKFYSTNNFSGVRIINVEGKHVGNNDFRDAFIGSTDVLVEPEYELDLPPVEAHIDMGRPLAKFNFITTDLDRVVEHMLELEAQAKAESENNEGQGENPRSDDPAEPASASADEPATASNDFTRGVNIQDYKVVFRYSQFMPNEFDIFSYIPIYALPNITFESEIKPLSDTEAELGFDYVFVNGEEFVIPIMVEVYDKQGNKVSGINPINVPLMRGQLTTVRDNFLTSQASGGIGINPDFEDPDYIYEVN
jgi:hypothetical protein